MRSTILRNPFPVAAAGVIVLCAFLVRTSAFAARTDLMSWGITFDLTITIPVLYWFFVVRTGKAPLLSIAPLFFCCAFIASALLPQAQQHFLSQLKGAAGPCFEVLLIAALIRRVRRFERSTPLDFHERIAAVARVIVGNGRLSQLLTTEVSLFYYALFCWRKRPEENPRAVTFHERNGWATILACIFVLIVAEGLAMHLLLLRWSVYVAWGWTLLDVWAMLWLLGDFHALRLRRTTFDEDAIRLRYGLRWSADIPRENVVAIEATRDEKDWKHRDVLRVAILDEPRWLIRFGTPVVVDGLAGMRKQVRAMALLPDDEGPLLEWKRRLENGS